jgi:hypothetical protein
MLLCVDIWMCFVKGGTWMEKVLEQGREESESKREKKIIEWLRN